jgi:hypothetical protein
MSGDAFQAEQKPPSMLDAAKHSLKEAERFEERAEDAGTVEAATAITATMRDELLLGILQSNIAVAEALTEVKGVPKAEAPEGRSAQWL